jgi:Zn-dependent protease/predicted transcriptional regulator
MFGRGITLIKLFGFEVKIDLSWLILGFLITWTLATGVFPTYDKGLSRTTYWVMGVVGALGLLVSIVFHELWHSLVARRFGLPMKGITLFVFGGVAEMSDEPPSPKAEFFMAVAGPLSSVFMGLALVGISFLGRHGAWPAFPLDGGRVLRSILWGWKNNVRWATHVASQIGSGFGIVLILVGVIEFLFGNLIGGIWMFLIGLFLRGASRSAYQQIVIRRALEGENVRKFMKENPVTVSSKVSLQEFVDDYIFRYHFKMFPVVDEGKLVGCVTLSQVKEVPREKWGSHLIGELAKGCSSANTISPDADAMKALSLMSRNNASRLMVVQGDKLVGVIALKDMMRLLSLKVDLEK